MKKYLIPVIFSFLPASQAVRRSVPPRTEPAKKIVKRDVPKSADDACAKIVIVNGKKICDE